MAEGAALVHETLGTQRRLPARVHFGDVDADFAAADRVVRRSCAGPAPRAAPLETSGAVVRSTPRSGRMDVWSNTNLLNFGAWVMSAARSASPPHLLNFHPAAGGRQLRLASTSSPSRSASRGRWRRPPGGP